MGFIWIRAVNNPAIILEALVQGRGSVDTSYIASSETKAQDLGFIWIRAVNNPLIILEALVQGRGSIDTPYIASSETKAQGHGIYLNKGPHDAGLCECGAWYQ